MKLAGG
jgi:intermembrane space import and assembly protein 40